MRIHFFVFLTIPVATLAHCVGDSTITPTDGGSETGVDATIDAPTTDGPSSSDVATEAEAGPPLTGAFSNVLVLPDTTIGSSGGFAIGPTGDVAVAGGLGSLSGPVNINNFSFASVGGNDVLVFKLAENNGFKWAKSFGGISDDLAYAVTMDASGDVYVAGSVFCSTATTTIPFGSSSVVCKHTSYSTFVAKLKGTDGTVQWVDSFDAAAGAGSSCNVVAVNPMTGSVAVGCTLSGDMAFTDTSNTPHTVTHKNATLGDIFLAELDPPTGHVSKSAYIEGPTADLVGQLTYDAAGDLYVTGALQATMSAFIPSTSTSSAFNVTRVGSNPSASDGYIVKLAAADWSHVWDHVYSSGALTTKLVGAAVDSANNVYVSGAFQGTADFGLGGMTAAGTIDGALVELSPTGTAVAQTQIGGNGVVVTNIRVAVDAANHVVIAGTYAASGAGMKIGSTQLPDANGGSYASFTAKYSSDLKTVIWAQGTACPTANTNGTGLVTTDVAIDPSNAQVGTFGGLSQATTDFGDGKQVTRAHQGLFFLRRDP